ncbi:MAG TPA: hypothetical protein VK395_07770 [Gemmataceae bacterium]|nr:hypothetical protein [Gemmataceae bacterium]
MARLILASFLMTALGVCSWVRADDQDAKTKPRDKSATLQKEEEALQQERLSKQFKDFELALLNMAQRLERSSKPEDRERAANLRQAIKKASESEVDNKFQALVALLRDNKALSLNEIRDAMDRSKMLVDDLNAILAMLLNDNRDAQLKAERERIRKLLEILNKIIRDQKVTRAQTESSGMESRALLKSQEKVTQPTDALAKAMSGKPKDGNGQGGKPGQPKPGQPGEKKPGEKKDGQQSPPNGNKQDTPQTPGQRQVEDAVKDQKRAEEELKKEKRDEASNKQDDAIKKLEEARKRLEEALRQLREEELQRLLANLQARCERMLAMQIEVYEGTMRVEKAIEQNPEKKAGRTEEQRSLQLSDREQEIVRQANNAIQLLENEGSAVAFPEVFTQVRDDMQHVARRLGKADVGRVTQSIEEDIIATLKEMIEALKKAAQAGKGGGKGNSNSQPIDKLIDLLAELKMIRSMQIRVNSRTHTYALQYTGEQANEPDIRKELIDLAQRQQRIFEVTNNLAKGKNN